MGFRVYPGLSALPVIRKARKSLCRDCCPLKGPQALQGPPGFRGKGQGSRASSTRNLRALQKGFQTAYLCSALGRGRVATRAYG